MLSQLMVLFGFFALVLVSIYWINQAVRLFDRLIGDGQSAFVFLEFTALTLPNVIRLVLPMSVFAGSVYVTNRLSSESELVVMQATGFSPWRLARPVMYYGLIVGVMMSVLTHVLVPISLGQMKLREAEISRNITARLLTEGTFLHPTDGVTFYIRDITLDGTLKGVFLSDRRSTERAMTYSASRAYLVNDDGEVKLVMVDGLAQSYLREGNRLFTTHFTDFSYDISELIGAPDLHVRQIRHSPTWELAREPAAIAAETGESVGRAIEELHYRVNQAFLCVVAALIGFSTLLVGGFSRFGVWRQIVAALVLLVIVKLVEGLVTDAVRADVDLWPLVYAPSIVGAAMSATLLHWAARPRRRRRAATMGTTEAAA
ncbi:LPS export ABC transporter permease LptF [Thalassovita aquimarina]|uniref:LPS export ABC transporter permease LptF n=1 Tax=Thalassovita aquimarina TaxID=2785917 RepID=A0ABS5HLT4_9RHOB|nr:LPS export ABC transporter permease LptF [Thalassovita aquimarina]MBR9649911.1 LPS export ABC transporter permease LptF [Thalassovita aquimarina]